MMIFAVAVTGPPFVMVVPLPSELKDAVEPAIAVEPESWLARGAWLMLSCGRPPNPLEFWKTGAVFVRSSGACAIAFTPSAVVVVREEVGEPLGGGDKERDRGW